MNIRTHEAWKRLNGGPKGTEILSIASPGLDLKRPGESEKAHGRPDGYQGSKTKRNSVNYKEK